MQERQNVSEALPARCIKPEGPTVTALLGNELEHLKPAGMQQVLCKGALQKESSPYVPDDGPGQAPHPPRGGLCMRAAARRDTHKGNRMLTNDAMSKAEGNGPSCQLGSKASLASHFEGFVCVVGPISLVR